MSEYVHLIPAQADRLAKINADNVAALSVHIRVKGIWLVGLVLRLGVAAAWLRIAKREWVAGWVAWAAGRLRAQTRVGRRGKWTDAGPIGLDDAIEALKREMSAIEQRRTAREKGAAA